MVERPNRSCADTTVGCGLFRTPATVSPLLTHLEALPHRALTNSWAGGATVASVERMVTVVGLLLGAMTTPDWSL
jgi:hypothetical protein